MLFFMVYNRGKGELVTTRGESWNETKAARFTDLRLRELSGELTVEEQAELADIISELEADEAKLLAPYFARLQAEQEVLKEKLTGVQAENDELAKLLGQQLVGPNG